MNELPNDDMLLDHKYDEIEEYDNPLPTWWSWIMIVTIVFSGAYIFWYHLGMGASVHQKYQGAVTAHIESLLEQLGEIRADNATILEFKDNEEWMAATESMFIGNCGQCHVNDGGGDIGPNLTDDAYKNVTEPADIFRIITEGVANTGMAPWENRMSEPQRILLSAYVARLRGTTPGKAKEAEGTEIPAWDTFLGSTDSPSAE